MGKPVPRCCLSTLILFLKKVCLSLCFSKRLVTLHSAAVSPRSDHKCDGGQWTDSGQQMQSLNQYKECAVGTSREARVGMDCGTDPAPRHRPECSGVYWGIRVSQEHLLNMDTFNPERSVPQVSKAVEIISAVSLPLKEPFNALAMPFLDLGTYFLTKESDWAAHTQETNSEFSERLTDRTGSLRGQENNRVGKEQSRPLSHEYLVQWCQPLDESGMLDQLRNPVKAVFGINVWMILNGEAQPDVTSFRAEGDV